MEQIATLGITVDANGAIRQVGQLDQKLQQLGVTSVSQTKNMGVLNAIHAEAVGHIGQHSLSYGRLENSVASFVGHAIGVPPVIEKITTAMGHFAVGSVELTGILIGMAAIAAAYEAITGGAKKAREEQEKLTQALSDRFKPKTGTGSDVLGEYTAALAQQKSAREHLRILMGAKNDLQVAAGYGAIGETAPLMGRDALIQQETERLRQANLARYRAEANGAGMLPTVTVHGSQEADRRAAAEALRASEEYWRKQYDMFQKARGELADLQETGRTYLRDHPSVSGVRGSVVDAVLGKQRAEEMQSTMPSIGINDGLNKEQIKMREKMGILVEHGDKNAGIMTQAIQASAGAIGQIIAQALNIGGGGLGSAIGGALGSGIAGGLGTKIGGGIGSVGGSILGPVGAVVGGLIGSALGGLFDHHKKAVDKNTQAINALTAALYNAPSGYKVAGARYQADNGRHIYETVANEAYYRSKRGGISSMSLAA